MARLLKNQIKNNSLAAFGFQLLEPVRLYWSSKSAVQLSRFGQMGKTQYLVRAKQITPGTLIRYNSYSA